MARSNAVGKLRDIVEAVSNGNVSPKAAIHKELGNITDEKVLHSQVLVVTYVGSMYHAGTKIFKTDKALQEDQFQGSIGLVVKVGPGAFKDDPPRGVFFHGMSVKVGDWVLTRPSDGLQLYIREVPCRLFEDVNVKMVVSDPEIFW